MKKVMANHISPFSNGRAEDAIPTFGLDSFKMQLASHRALMETWALREFDKLAEASDSWISELWQGVRVGKEVNLARIHAVQKTLAVTGLIACRLNEIHKPQDEEPVGHDLSSLLAGVFILLFRGSGNFNYLNSALRIIDQILLNDKDSAMVILVLETNTFESLL